MNLPSTFTEDQSKIYAVIETPQGSRNKYDYNEEQDFFELKKVLPAGTSFPVDFGFIPHTLGEDGDPIDVLVIADFPFFTGCIVECRVVGVLTANQKEKGKKEIRNDRIIAIAAESLNYSEIRAIKDISENLIDEIVHFFKYYNKMEEKKFRVLSKGNKNMALDLIKKSMDDKKR
jgi:inorganic pyrophosphatase